MSAFDDLETQLVGRIADRAPAAAAHAAGSTTGPGRAPEPSRRRWWLGAATVGLAGAAIVAAAVLPGGERSPARLLTPEQAVAAVSSNLESDGILEWVDVQGQAAAKPGTGTGTEIARWVDLKTADHSEFQTMTYPGRDGRQTRALVFIWNVGRTNWLDEGERSKTTGKRIVRKTVVDRPPVRPEYFRTPVTQVRRDLARAAAGKIPIEDAGRIDGVPAVRIVDARDTFTRRVWISRERSPRVLRSSFTMACMEKLDGRCRPDMPNTVYAPQTSESRTLTWRIHPRTDAWLARVHPPAFDPAKFTVMTTHRD